LPPVGGVVQTEHRRRLKIEQTAQPVMVWELLPLPPVGDVVQAKHRHRLKVEQTAQPVTVWELLQLPPVGDVVQTEHRHRLKIEQTVQPVIVWGCYRASVDDPCRTDTENPDIERIASPLADMPPEDRTDSTTSHGLGVATIAAGR
jgi:hypothetical protein